MFCGHMARKGPRVGPNDPASVKPCPSLARRAEQGSTFFPSAAARCIGPVSQVITAANLANAPSCRPFFRIELLPGNWPSRH